jgi:hypothetical protein
MRGVGRQFDIHETIRKKWLKLKLIGGPKMGRKTNFAYEQALQLCDRLLLLSNMFGSWDNFD